jgi:hypothetical protein
MKANLHSPWLSGDEETRIVPFDSLATVMKIRTEPAIAIPGAVMEYDKAQAFCAEALSVTAINTIRAANLPKEVVIFLSPCSPTADPNFPGTHYRL